MAGERLTRLWGIVVLWLAIAEAAAGRDTLLWRSYWQDWQSQILEQVDVDQLTEEAYEDLLETLSDLEWSPRDSTTTRVEQQVLLRSDRCLTPREGYRHPTDERRRTDKAYLGNAWHQSVRYRLKTDRQWSAAVTLDKSAGERYGDGSVGAFLEYNAKASPAQGFHLRRLIVGDFRVELGSGLLVNQRFTMGKQLMGSQFFSGRKALSGHASTDEYNHMRGAAAEMQVGRSGRLLAFASTKWEGGAIRHDTLTSLRTDGMHRTQSEAEQRRQSWLTQAGLSMEQRASWYTAALNLRYLHSELPYFRRVQTYNRNWFRGQDLGGASLALSAQRYGLTMRSEVAVDDKGGWAGIAALTGRMGEAWRWSTLGRLYSNRYRQLQAAAVSESSAMQGERGLMVSVEGEPWRHTKVRLMADYFHLTSPQYGIDAPSHGGEVVLHVEHQRRTWNVSANYKGKVKQKNKAATTSGDLTNYLRHTVDAVFTMTPGAGWRLRTQMRSRTYSQQDRGGYTFGYAVAQSVGWAADPDQKGVMGRLSADAQATWFDTDDYETRIYLTERQILYGYGLPMLQNRGIRLALTLHYAIARQWMAEAKWALTDYANVGHLGTGLQRIEGNRRQDLWLQLRYRF